MITKSDFSSWELYESMIEFLCEEQKKHEESDDLRKNEFSIVIDKFISELGVDLYQFDDDGNLKVVLR